MFMRFAYAKKFAFDNSFRLHLMLALCASCLCEPCITLCFMPAFCQLYARFFDKNFFKHIVAPLNFKKPYESSPAIVQTPICVLYNYRTQWNKGGS